MSRSVFIGMIVLIAFLSACSNGPGAGSRGSIIMYTSFDELKPMLERENDTLYVYNFWATWCVPCVKELKNFEEVNADYAGRKVKVVLISLDWSEDLETKLKPFIKERDIRSQVINLDDPNANRWIPMVDQSWDGAIPATLFRYGKEKIFMVHTFTHEELVNEIEDILNK
ncbi:MAG: TlpA family protein disulfide reductase [Bacteroidota bacterium]